MDKPRFSEISCSQCGRGFGAGNNGFSHCSSHRQPSDMSARDLAERLLSMRGPWLSRLDDAALIEASRRLSAEHVQHDAQKLIGALDAHAMWINPQSFNEAAGEVDCGGCRDGCRWASRDGPCRKSEAGEYCYNDLAETLRAVGVVALAAEVDRNRGDRQDENNVAG